jgi:competence protein ComEC
VIGLLAGSSPAQSRIEIHFIDVGQGDAVLVTSPKKDCVIVIDSGDTRYPASSRNFRSYLQKKLPLGSKIDLAVASHPHSDHVGSMTWVLRNYRVGTFVDNGVEYDSAMYRELAGEVRRQVGQKRLRYFSHDQLFQSEQFCPSPSVRPTFLLPHGGYERQFCDKNPNNCSVVFRLNHESVSLLFVGDAEEEQEAMLLGETGLRSQLGATVLKVPHHGSDTSSSREFLDAVAPRWMVVSAGKKNVGTNKSFMHPRLSTVRNLLDFAGRQVNLRDVDVYDSQQKVWGRKRIWGNLLFTEKDGTVVLSSDGSKVAKQ